jgi:hypothetical protein
VQELEAFINALIQLRFSIVDTLGICDNPHCPVHGQPAHTRKTDAVTN